VTINLNPLAHHGFKVGWLLAIPSALLNTGRDPWPITTAYIVVGAIGSLLILLGWVHSSESCPQCRRRPAARLTRRTSRAWAACGRHGGLPVLAVVAAWSILGSQVHVLSGRHYAPYRISFALLWTLIALYLAARRYNEVQYAIAPPHRIRDWLHHGGAGLVHRGTLLVLVALALNIPTIFLPQDGPWGLVGWATVLLLFAALYLSYRHTSTLCEECVTEFRIDAPEYAALRGWRFTAMHRLPLMTAGWAATVASHWMPHPWKLGIQVAWNASVAGSAVLTAFHTKYQPWCPYCSGGDGGDGEAEEVPDPAPNHGKPLPVA
jgi:hypothetical protein